jgi:tetratricopeptide (TPR) repeat protein
MHCFLSQHLLDPRDDSVRRHLADNGPRGERLDEAMISAAADLRRAIRYGPRARRRTLRTAAKASAAKVAAKGARWQVAARNYEALLKDDPLQPALMVRYARALEELGLADDARATLRNAAWSQPDCLDTQLRLARLLMSQKDLEGARAAFRKAAHMGLSRPVLDQELRRLGILEREAEIAYWDALAREIRDNAPRSLSHQASAFLARHAQRWINAAPK